MDEIIKILNVKLTQKEIEVIVSHSHNEIIGAFLLIYEGYKAREKEGRS